MSFKSINSITQVSPKKHMRPCTSKRLLYQYQRYFFGMKDVIYLLSRYVEHIIIECTIAQMIWSNSPWTIKFPLMNFSNAYEMPLHALLTLNLSHEDSMNFLVFVVVCCDSLYMAWNKQLKEPRIIDTLAFTHTRWYGKLRATR